MKECQHPCTSRAWLNNVARSVMDRQCKYALAVAMARHTRRREREVEASVACDRKWQVESDCGEAVWLLHHSFVLSPLRKFVRLPLHLFVYSFSPTRSLSPPSLLSLSNTILFLNPHPTLHMPTCPCFSKVSVLQSSPLVSLISSTLPPPSLPQTHSARVSSTRRGQMVCLIYLMFT
jgi:hypothetical protein